MDCSSSNVFLDIVRIWVSKAVSCYFKRFNYRPQELNNSIFLANRKSFIKPLGGLFIMRF